MMKTLNLYRRANQLWHRQWYKALKIIFRKQCLNLLLNINQQNSKVWLTSIKRKIINLFKLTLLNMISLVLQIKQAVPIKNGLCSKISKMLKVLFKNWKTKQLRIRIKSKIWRYNLKKKIWSTKQLDVKA